MSSLLSGLIGEETELTEKVDLVEEQVPQQPRLDLRVA